MPFDGSSARGTRNKNEHLAAACLHHHVYCECCRLKVEPLATFCVCACSVSSDHHHRHHLIIASSLCSPLLCLGSRPRSPSLLSDPVCRTWPRRMASPHPEDTWRVCINCSGYEPFQDQTDTCCRTERGVACIFPPQGRSVGTDARIRARGPPQGSRSRSRNRISNHDSLAEAAHEAAERAADRAGAAAREAEGAAARAAGRSRGTRGRRRSADPCLSRAGGP